MFSRGAKENIGKEKVMNKNGCICISSFFDLSMDLGFQEQAEVKNVK